MKPAEQIIIRTKKGKLIGSVAIEQGTGQAYSIKPAEQFVIRTKEGKLIGGVGIEQSRDAYSMKPAEQIVIMTKEGRLIGSVGTEQSRDAYSMKPAEQIVIMTKEGRLTGRVAIEQGTGQAYSIKPAEQFVIRTKEGRRIGCVGIEQSREEYRPGLRLVQVSRGKYEVRFIKLTDDGRMFYSQQPYAEMEGPKKGVVKEFKKMGDDFKKQWEAEHNKYKEIMDAASDEEDEDAGFDFASSWAKVFRGQFPNFFKAREREGDTAAGLAVDLLLQGCDVNKVNLSIARKASYTKLKEPDKLDLWLLDNWKKLKPLKPAERLKLVQEAKVVPKITDSMLRARLSRLDMTYNVHRRKVPLPRKKPF
jgi:hypothetical protein